MSFQISAIPAEPFEHLFGQPTDVLRLHGAKRKVVKGPCSLSQSCARKY